MTQPKIINEIPNNKTRILIAGGKSNITSIAMILHVMQFHQKDIDFVLKSDLKGFDQKVKLSDDNDFIILEDSEDYPDYQPNIVLISRIKDNVPFSENEVENYRNIIENITSGGILIYPSENQEIEKLVEQSEKYFRKIPYSTPPFEIKNGIIYLDTTIGNIPLSIQQENHLLPIEGSRWMCQQLGIMEEDFYEAIINFED